MQVHALHLALQAAYYPGNPPSVQFPLAEYHPLPRKPYPIAVPELC